MKKRISIVTWILLIAAIFSAVLIAVFDIGSSSEGTSGAGDIWWVDVPAVEQSYLKITNKR
ncbi:MAG: hypothetical protein KGZ79_06895 [Dethiobacter sp.]|jgi:hypothetical protein|nr:hypothetical protein [Dethiobacter sp.]